MEKLATQIAETIASAMNYDQNKQEVLAYGLIGLFQIITIFAAISIIGLFAGFWFESIIIFLGVGLLRKSTGGSHAQTLLGCTIVSITLISILSGLCRYVLMNISSLFIFFPVLILLLAVSLLIAYHKVPVDNPNKPIRRPEKIKRLRKQSFITITVYGAICICFSLLSFYNLRFISLAYAVLCALLWQILTLTRYGAALIDILDTPFRKKDN